MPAEAGGDGAASLFDASGDARVRILRIDNSTQKPVTHGYFPATVTEEIVSETFGGGKYRAQLVIPDPATGLQKIKRTRDFTIPGPYKPPQRINTFDQAGENAALPAGTPAGLLGTASQVAAGGDDLMQVLKAGIINTVLELMKSTKEINRAPTADPIMVEFMKSQAQAQAQMMQIVLAMITKEQPKQDSETRDVLSMMAKFKELMGPTGAAVPANPIEMFSTMLDAFKTFREAADDVATPRNDVDPLLGSLPRIAEVVYEQHQMQKESRAAQALTHVNVPGPAGGVLRKPEVRQVQEQPETPPLPLWQRILRQQSKRLIDAANAKHDPDVLAGMAIMFANADILESLKTFFHRDEPEIVTDIIAEIPPLAEHREWVESFVNSAQFRLFPDEFPEDGEEELEVPEVGGTSE